MCKIGEYVKKLNMKVAGTLPYGTKAKKDTQPQADIPKPNYEGMTSKQKKNLRKKLQKRRKKLDQT
jgi:hypothetical protein